MRHCAYDVSTSLDVRLYALLQTLSHTVLAHNNSLIPSRRYKGVKEIIFNLPNACIFLVKIINFISERYSILMQVVCYLLHSGGGRFSFLLVNVIVILNCLLYSRKYGKR